MHIEHVVKTLNLHRHLLKAYKCCTVPCETDFLVILISVIVYMYTICVSYHATQTFSEKSAILVYQWEVVMVITDNGQTVILPGLPKRLHTLLSRLKIL